MEDEVPGNSSFMKHTGSLTFTLLKKYPNFFLLVCNTKLTSSSSNIVTVYNYPNYIYIYILGGKNTQGSQHLSFFFSLLLN